MHEQVTDYGLERLFAEAIKLGPHVARQIRLSKGQDSVPGRLGNTSEGDFRAKSVIIASGSQFRKLGMPGEAELVGKGVTYCATCDGYFSRDKAVAVIGGGNTALTEAIYLSKFASKVSIIHGRDELRASKVLQEKPRQNKKLISFETPW